MSTIATVNKTLPKSRRSFDIDDGNGYRAKILAKDFPNFGDHGEFRVYRIYGDINNQRAFQNAIFRFLASYDVERRKVVLTNAPPHWKPFT